MRAILRWRRCRVCPRSRMYYEDQFIGWGKVERTGSGWVAEGPVRSRVRRTVAAARLYVENQVRDYMRIPREQAG